MVTAIEDSDIVNLLAAIIKTSNVKPDWNAVKTELGLQTTTGAVAKRYERFLKRRNNPKTPKKPTSTPMAPNSTATTTPPATPTPQVGKTIPMPTPASTGRKRKKVESKPEEPSGTEDKNSGVGEWEGLGEIRPEKRLKRRAVEEEGEEAGLGV